MIISWLLGSMTDSIKRSVIFVTNCAKIWKELEHRYLVTNGARIYIICKDIYETKQIGRIIYDYYTDMKALWEVRNLLHISSHHSNDHKGECIF